MVEKSTKLMKSPLGKKKRKEWIFAYCMIAFAVIQFAVFYVGVNANSIVMAFTSKEFIDGEMTSRFSFYNFERFFRDIRLPGSVILLAIKNTMKYFLTSTLITLPLTFLFAYFLYKKILGYKFFRVVFYLPSIISAVIFVAMFKNIIGVYGPLYRLIHSLTGYELPPLIAEDATATATIIFYCIWTGFGVNLVLFQGAMSRIPQEVVEAGQLDGIKWWQEQFLVTAPMIWPTISIMILLNVTGLFNSSGPILLFQPYGGASTMTVSFWIFSQVKDGAAQEYPAALGIIFTVISLPILFGMKFLLQKIDPGVEY